MAYLMVKVFHPLGQDFLPWQTAKVVLYRWGRPAKVLVLLPLAFPSLNLPGCFVFPDLHFILEDGDVVEGHRVGVGVAVRVEPQLRVKPDNIKKEEVLKKHVPALPNNKFLTVSLCM